MKRLACFLLEGLVEQGPHHVWITLGTFDSAAAAGRSSLHRSHRLRVIETRVIALYRDSGITAASNHRTHFAGTSTATPAGSTGITVA